MKVLIVSHTVLSLDGNMGKTLRAYFQDWCPEDLCQLYFQSEVPTTRLCERYFRVTDMDLVNALRFRKPGQVFGPKDIQEERRTSWAATAREDQLYRIGKKRSPMTTWGRNALWRLGAWKTKELDAWMQQQKPDVIFYASGDYVFSFRVVQYLAEKYGIPVVTAVFDDYYFHRSENSSLLAKWNTKVFRKTMERMMKTAAGAVYVHPAMQKAYDGVFGRRGQVLYTAAERTQSIEPETGSVRITYLGGLGLKRDEALLEVSRLLNKLDSSVLLDVYSDESRPEILKHLTEENGIRFHGAASASEVRRIEAESHILLLAESQDPALLERLRYSLSTKVAEYLGSGRCMLAYGPKEAGSISYLLAEGGLCVATSPVELEEKLREVLTSPEARQTYAKAQLVLAEKNHTLQRNSAVLKEVLKQAENA